MKRVANLIAFVLSLGAVLAVAVALQAFSDLYNRRVDLTETQLLSLSPYTLSVLSEIKQPLKVGSLTITRISSASPSSASVCGMKP